MGGRLHADAQSLAQRKVVSSNLILPSTAIDFAKVVSSPIT